MKKTPKQHREYIKDNVKKIRNARITSGYRNNSSAHRNGAVDIASKELTEQERHTEAKKISEKLGNNYIVVVEEVSGNKQTNTAYQNGQKGKTRTNLDKKASATHTHIQPKIPNKKTTNIKEREYKEPDSFDDRDFDDRYNNEEYFEEERDSHELREDAHTDDSGRHI